MEPSIAFHKRFSNRLAFWILGLLGLAQLVIWTVVSIASYNSAEKSIEDSMVVAEKVFRTSYQRQLQSLQASIQVLLSDWAFKKAIGTGDAATIQSVMESQMSPCLCRDFPVQSLR